MRRLAAVLSCLAVGVVVAAPAEAVGARLTLAPIASRPAGIGFTPHGVLSHVGPRHNKTVLLQVRRSGHWVTVGRRLHEHDGPYAFAKRVFTTPRTRVYRTLVKRHGHLLDVSPARTAVITPSPELLPDLQVKKLDACSQAEKDEATAHGGTSCFYIVHTDAGQSDDRKLLKFAAVTFNVGAGPMEVRSTRSTNLPDPPESSWTATSTVQRIYHDANGDGLPDARGYVDRPIAAKFYWEQLPSGVDNHGHTHWHILDFDSYSVVGESSASEKHGFCLEDNTSYQPWYDDPAGHPEVPHSSPILDVRGQLSDPGVYVGADFNGTTCGYKMPAATSIEHGLSVGWGDTYPSSLPDQGIDITSLDPSGTITVAVTADGQNLLKESDETNNTAGADVTIDGDTVTAVHAFDNGL